MESLDKPRAGLGFLKVSLMFFSVILNWINPVTLNRKPLSIIHWHWTIFLEFSSAVWNRNKTSVWLQSEPVIDFLIYNNQPQHHNHRSLCFVPFSWTLCCQFIIIATTLNFTYHFPPKFIFPQCSGTFFSQKAASRSNPELRNVQTSTTNILVWSTLKSLVLVSSHLLLWLMLDTAMCTQFFLLFPQGYFPG